MKSNGIYLIGIDFGAGDQSDMWVVPVRGHAPIWHKAESISKDRFEKIFEEAREREREKRRQIEEARERAKAREP